MTRWAPDARARLESSAVRLFREQGFAATTVQQITADAGLTTRTFFRHFTDKAEVLFADSDLTAYLSDVVNTHFEVDTPIASMHAMLDVVATERFELRRGHLLRLRELLASDDRLRERDTTKRALLSDVLRSELERLGSPVLEADLLATIATKVLFGAVERWLDDDAPDRRTLTDHIADGVGALVGLFVDP